MSWVYEFPGLGIKFNASRVAFKLFGIEIYWYALIIATALLLAVILALRSANKYGFTQDDIIDLVLFNMPVAFIFARAYYVIFKWDFYSKNPKEIINLRGGGIAIYGAIIGIMLTTYLYCRYKKINILKLLDFVVPYVALGQAIGRWGNFMNQEAYGSQTTLPWRMGGSNIVGTVHPTFLYESLWSLALFILLLWFRDRVKNNGENFFLYMAGYGLGRAWIEGLRTDSLFLGPMRISQVLAIIFVIVFTAAFITIRKKKSAEMDAVAEVGLSEYAEVLNEVKSYDQEDASEIKDSAKDSEQKSEESFEDKDSAESEETGEAKESKEPVQENDNVDSQESSGIDKEDKDTENKTKEEADKQ